MGLMDNDVDMQSVENRFINRHQKEFEKHFEESVEKAKNTPKRGPGDHISEGNLNMTVYGY